MQVWASDNTDVFSRMAIQHGTSLAYPLCSIGSHITSVPNHQTQRLSTLKTRFLVALFGTFGLELDVRRLALILPVLHDFFFITLLQELVHLKCQRGSQ